MHLIVRDIVLINFRTGTPVEPTDDCSHLRELVARHPDSSMVLSSDCDCLSRSATFQV